MSHNLRLNNSLVFTETAQILSCGGITHINNSSKTNVTAIWIPPAGYTERANFVVTIVLGKTYSLSFKRIDLDFIFEKI